MESICVSVKQMSMWLTHFPLKIHFFSYRCDYLASVSILIQRYATTALCSDVSRRLGRQPRADPEGVLLLPVHLMTFTHRVLTAMGLITGMG